MKMVITLSLVLFLNLSATNAWASRNIVGFMIDDTRSILAFKNSDKKWELLNEGIEAGVKDEKFKIFFNGKSLGDVQIKQPSSALSRTTKVNLSPELNKARSSLKLSWSWGELAKTTMRPLLISNKTSLGDPENWRPIDYKSLAKDLRSRIETAALLNRTQQNCTQEGAAAKSIIISAKDIMIVKAYASSGQRKLAVAVKFKEIPGLAECNGQEFGISSSYVVWDGKSARNLLSETDFRDLTLLEAADVNGDGISELYFADQSYDFDGFSVFDFGSGVLLKKGFSSH